MTLILDENKRKLNIKKFFEDKIKPSILRNSKAHNKALSAEQKERYARSLATVQAYSAAYFEALKNVAVQPQKHALNPRTNISTVQNVVKAAPQYLIARPSNGATVDLYCHEKIDFDILDYEVRIPKLGKKQK